CASELGVGEYSSGCSYW
nr:immunoglobulin heavy chain junction region [Macaca mulatta]MOV47930.1 immunoglobulin heavy chain junction region [Macaca mulatta]MOV48069.1 immunoglobulin heavy chain junction region [Macaca mulatta]MOV48787.1 immunoglobulin heavy chain junction region [Macaca mulatta]MOV48983.1 immunoglobulin heavy chain junction region [Macaca mulatta]